MVKLIEAVAGTVAAGCDAFVTHDMCVTVESRMCVYSLLIILFIGACYMS